MRPYLEGTGESMLTKKEFHKMLTKTHPDFRPNSIELRLLTDYGETHSFSLCSWILSDGTLVNGSYEGYQRDFDHGTIAEYYKTKNTFKAVQKFMRRGNIRCMCHEFGYLFQFTVPLTENQKKQLKNAEHKAQCRNIPFLVQKTKNGSVKKAYHSTIDKCFTV